MNLTNDPGFKSQCLHNLAVILQYEIKTHNKFIDDVIERKKQLEEYKKSKEYNNEEKYDLLIKLDLIEN
jgi:hypothetical protein